jgi:predicted nucleic acid-binding protein
VVTELTRDRTPDIVKKWLEDKPDWLHVQAPTQTSARIRQDLGEGERQAIELALEMAADALLVDDRDARHEAQKHGVAVLGTLRVLADASEHGLADLAATSFESSSPGSRLFRLYCLISLSNDALVPGPFGPSA